MSGLDVLSARPLALRTHTDVLTAQRLDLDYYLPERVAAEAQVVDGRFRTATLNALRRKDRPITDGIRRHDKSDSGVHLIRTQNIIGPSVDYGATAFINEEWHRTSLKSEVLPGDLLVAIRGYLGAAAIVVDGSPRANINQHIARIGIDETKCSIRYLWSFLSSRVGRTILERYVTGTVQRGVTLPDLRALRVPLPDRRIQNFIGAKVELAERCRALASREHEKLAADLEALYQGCPHDAAASLSTMVGPAEMDGSRLDAWYHQRHFITLTDWLRRNPAFVELGKVASLSSDRWSPGAHGQSTFRYIEISNVDPSTGHVSHSEVPVENAPSRARKLVRRFDVLASTVRPNRGAVGLVPDSLDGAVATTGFAVVRPASKTDAFFVLAVLRHPASTAQLMRCNTGSAYPAIEESVLPQIWIPGAKPETRKSLGARELKRTTLLQTAVDLVDQAKADVDALVEGTLDVQAILSGTLKAPSADDIPELAEDGA